MTTTDEQRIAALSADASCDPCPVPSCRGYRCLDRNLCFKFTPFEAATVAHLLHPSADCDAETELYQRSIAYINRDGDLQRISIDSPHELMQCTYTDKLLFQTTRLVRNYQLWGYTASSSGGFDHLTTPLPTTHVSTKVAIGHEPSLRDVERNSLGLFATPPFQDGEIIGEYTGVVQLDLGVDETPWHDAYGLCYPSVYEVGQLSTPNARFTPMIYDGILHVFCFATCPIEARSQIFVDYGPTYWQRAGVMPLTDM